jgi:hypothetical protein
LDGWFKNYLSQGAVSEPKIGSSFEIAPIYVKVFLRNPDPSNSPVSWHPGTLVLRFINGIIVNSSDERFVRK